MNYLQAINYGAKILKCKNFLNYNLDSELLLSNVLKLEREELLINLDKEIYGKSFNYFKKLINRRIKREPIAYILKKKEFWKYEFDITEDVLIPRPDTETVLEQALKFTKNKSRLKVLDIGVGSGCILLSILKERKGFYGTGIDIYKKTLDICKTNIKKLDLNDRVKLFKSDIDNFNYGKYDLIISNPPYISRLNLKYLENDVVDFEPKLALDGGLDGLTAIKKVVNKSSKLLKKSFCSFDS